MTSLEHDLGPEGRMRTPARPVTTQRTGADRPAPLLDLQRLAGNAAVTRALLANRVDGGIPVQRLDTDTDTDTDEDESQEEMAQLDEQDELDEELGEEEEEAEEG